MMLDWNAYRDQINAAVKEMAAANPDIVKANAGLHHANSKSTQIDAKTRELIALGVEADSDLIWSRLMASAQDGDRAAYERLLREVVAFIEALVSREQRSNDRVDEVVQDVLLTVHRIRHTYDPSRPFKPWLSAIARRRSIDLLRRRGRRESLEVSGDKAYETFADPQANRTMESTRRPRV